MLSLFQLICVIEKCVQVNSKEETEHEESKTTQISLNKRVRFLNQEQSISNNISNNISSSPSRYSWELDKVFDCNATNKIPKLETNASECMHCYKSEAGLLKLQNCSHSAHTECLYDFVTFNLIRSKHILYCQDVNWTSLISREDIKSVISNIESILYDTLQFLDEFTSPSATKILYWCKHCRSIDFKFEHQSKHCSKCGYRISKLK